MVILVTDGQANEREGDTLTMAQRLKDSGAYIVTVGVTDQIDAAQLRVISSNGQVLAVSDFSGLASILGPIVSATCDIPVQSKYYLHGIFFQPSIFSIMCMTCTLEYQNTFVKSLIREV